MNVGSVLAGVVAALAASRFDAFAVSTLLAAVIANVAAGMLWLMAGASEWSRSRAAALGYVVLGGGASALLFTILGTLLLWSGV